MLAQFVSARALLGASVLVSHLPGADIQVHILEGDLVAPLPNLVREIALEWGLEDLGNIIIQSVDVITPSFADVDFVILETEQLPAFKKFKTQGTIEVVVIESAEGRDSSKISGELSSDLSRINFAKIVREYIKIVFKLENKTQRNLINAFIPLRGEDCDLA